MPCDAQHGIANEQSADSRTTSSFSPSALLDTNQVSIPMDSTSIPVQIDWRAALPAKRRRNDDKSSNDGNNNISKRSFRDPRVNNFNIETKNKFNILANTELNSSTNEPNKLIQKRPPPIHVKSEVEFLQFKNCLLNLTGPDSFSCVATTQGVTIYPATPLAYRSIVRSLRENTFQFHTYQLADDKSFRVVIRGLHHTVGEEIITSELKNLGYQVRSVTNVLSREKVKLPLFFVDLDPDPKNVSIFKLNALFMSKIKVEEPRQKRQIVQCIRCQSYGHTKAYCNLPPRCVRCADRHESKDCTKSRETPATCALCNGTHPANYRGCTVHKQLQNRRSPITAQRTQPPPPPDHSTTNFPHLPKPTTELNTFPKTSYQSLSNPHRQPTVLYSQTLTRQPEPGPDVSLSNISQVMNSFLTEIKNILTPILTMMAQLTQLLVNHNAK